MMVQCPDCGMHMSGSCSYPRCPFLAREQPDTLRKLAELSDAALVEELKLRGYTITRTL